MLFHHCLPAYRLSYIVSDLDCPHARELRKSATLHGIAKDMKAAEQLTFSDSPAPRVFMGFAHFLKMNAVPHTEDPEEVMG